MYINFPLLEKSGLQNSDLVFLAAIKQNETEFLLKNLKEDDYNRFKTLSLVKHVKVKKKDEHLYVSLRLDKKGSDLLENLSTAEVTEDSLRIFEWIKQIYLSAGKSLGNQKKTKTFIAQFTAESGIEKNCLAFLIQTFVNDEKEMEFSKVLQYLFFKGESVFNVRFDLHASRLYQYYLKNENYFKEQFKRLE
jgi:hypothetical protein